MFAPLCTAFVTLLFRYTGQEDIIVGFSIANRDRKETEQLAGLFTNTLVLRTDLSDNPAFLELLDRVQKITLEDRSRLDLPFERPVEELQPERDPSRHPLFQVTFTTCWHMGQRNAQDQGAVRLQRQSAIPHPQALLG